MLTAKGGTGNLVPPLELLEDFLANQVDDGFALAD